MWESSAIVGRDILVRLVGKIVRMVGGPLFSVCHILQFFPLRSYSAARPTVEKEEFVRCPPMISMQKMVFVFVCFLCFVSFFSRNLVAFYE